jgi:alkaline phosphatase
MAKGNYVDGFVIPIPVQNTAAYKKMAREASRVWKKYGALDYKECIIEDEAPQFVANPFAKMAKTKPGETVWFSFIVFKSKAHRNAVNKKVMAYFSKKYEGDMGKSMPFDMKRFAYGGFKVMVSS